MTDRSEAARPAKRLLRAPEAAEFLGVKPATLADWRLTGKGPAFRRLGRAVAYAIEDLNAWVDQRPAFQSTAAAHEAARAQRGAA